MHFKSVIIIYGIANLDKRRTCFFKQGTVYMEYLSGIFLLLGGIGLFLYGISFMTQSLEKAAGDNLRTVLEKMTSKGIFALLVGTVVTVLIQSSGATSVMVVGFVNAGLMNLAQSLYIMLGANIGTTITGQIIAFNITSIAPLILFIGIILYMFVKNSMLQKIGGVVLGFGMLFVGIYIMGMAVDTLALENIVSAFLNKFSNPVLSLLFGFVITAIIQSSSASIGILQVIFAASAISADQFNTVFYIILGMNIGACSPVVIASIGSNTNCKQSALANFLSKMISAAVFMIFIMLLPNFSKFIVSLSPNSVARQIANFHTLFNIVSSALLFPFVGLISKLVIKLIPNDEEEEKKSKKLLYINADTILTPSIAVTQVKREVMRMAEMTYKNISLALEAFFSENVLLTDKVFDTEKTINFLNHEITAFLIKLYGKNITPKELESVAMMFHVVADIERIGDHAENIAEYTIESKDMNVDFNKIALDELKEISENSIGVFKKAIEVYDGELFDQLPVVSRLEEHVDDLQKKFIEEHIERLKKGKCTPRSGVIFTDMVSDLERCADHAINIAYSINGEKSSVQVKKSYILVRGEDMN